MRFWSTRLNGAGQSRRSQRSERHRGRRAARRHGLSLVEASLATAIVGIGCLASLNLLAAGTMSNLEGAEQTTGINLARNIRERSIQTPFATLCGMSGTSYSPPLDARGVSLNNLATWQQVVTVQAVNPTRLTQDIVDSNPSVVRVTVLAKHNGHTVADLNWYVFAPPVYPPG